MKKLLPYGLQGSALKHILEVNNGLDCNCICPSCGARLIARNNPDNTNAAHFAHYSANECEGAYETTLHLLAKEVLSEAKQLLLPPYHYDYDPANEKSLFRCKDGKLVEFDTILLEEPVDTKEGIIIPDAIGIKGEKQIFIEFAKTHFIDTAKEGRIKQSGRACIEIDLSEQPLDKVALIKFFKSLTPTIYWISNPRFDQEYKDEQNRILQVQEDLKKRKEQEDIAWLDRYRNRNDGQVLNVLNGQAVNCPKSKATLHTLRSTSFYSHATLKRIIDTGRWNCKFYGHGRKYIYLDGKEITVYPFEFDQLESEEQDQCDFLYRGLNVIQSFIEEDKHGICEGCHFADTVLTSQNKKYQFCKHP